MEKIDELVESHITEGTRDFDMNEAYQQIFFMLEGARSYAKVTFPEGQRPRNGSTKIAVELEPGREASIFTVSYVGKANGR